jgi:ADP-ribosylglycohydrolase
MSSQSAISSTGANWKYTNQAAINDNDYSRAAELTGSEVLSNEVHCQATKDENRHAATLDQLRTIKGGLRSATTFAVTPQPDGYSLNEWSIFDPALLSTEEKLHTIDAAKKAPLLDRAMGCIAGMAIADAVGHPLEFLDACDEAHPTHGFDLESMTYRNPFNKFRLKPGQWTDDASMGLCMADSLLANKAFNGADMRVRFWNWWFRGYNNAFRLDDRVGHSCGLGGNISNSLFSMKPGETVTPCYEAQTEDAGNGSLMRLAPIPIFCHDDVERAREMAAESSYTTHPGPIAAEACKLLAHIVVRAMELGAGDSKAAGARQWLDEVMSEYYRDVLQPREGEPGTDEIRRLVLGVESADSKERNWNWRSVSLDIEGTLTRRGRTYNGYPVSAGYFGAYSVDGLALALHSFYHTQSFDKCIEKCVNHLGDADSTGAIAGQIAGAYYGWSSIDARMQQNLLSWDEGEVALRGALLCLPTSPPSQPL